MKKSCILIDDEKTARTILKKYISNVPFLELKAEFTNAVDAIEILKSHKIDIIFLDIEIPIINGINFAKSISTDSKIIFTTAHREFAVEGFEINALDYLLKPFSFERFLIAVQRSISNQQIDKNEENNSYLFIKVNKNKVKINFNDIYYIEGLSNYLKFVTKTGVLIEYNQLKNVSNYLPKNFVRIHKSYIVNIKNIIGFNKDFVEIEKKQIPISATFKAAFLQLIEIQ